MNTALWIFAKLLAVAKSGYYAWCKKAQSKQESMNEELLKMITEIFAEHHGRYGSPRITKALRQCGWKCNHKRVERLMHEQGLQARVRKRWKPRTTDSRHPHPIAPNLLLNQPHRPASTKSGCRTLLICPPPKAGSTWRAFWISTVGG